MLQFFVIVTVKETQQVFIKLHNFRLQLPGVDIICPAELTLGASSRVKLKFKNNLPVSLSRVHFLVEGKGLCPMRELSHKYACMILRANGNVHAYICTVCACSVKLHLHVPNACVHADPLLSSQMCVLLAFKPPTKPSDCTYISDSPTLFYIAPPPLPSPGDWFYQGPKQWWSSPSLPHASGTTGSW